MRLGLVAALVMLCLLPTAFAQIPDPGDAVLLLCGTVGGVEPQAREALPLCPREEPAAPADPQDETAAAPPTPADPDAPDQAAALADEAIATAAGVADEPASAPERVAGFLGAVLAFIQELLQLPTIGAERIALGGQAAFVAVKDAGAAAVDATANGLGDIGEATSAVFDRIGALFASRTEAPEAPPAKIAAHVRLRGTSDLPLGKIREMLPEG